MRPGTLTRAGAHRSVDYVLALIRYERRVKGVNASRIFVGGFGQGGALALAVAMQSTGAGPVYGEVCGESGRPFGGSGGVDGGDGALCFCLYFP
jgi:predicted esterase